MDYRKLLFNGEIDKEIKDYIDNIAYVDHETAIRNLPKDRLDTLIKRLIPLYLSINKVDYSPDIIFMGGLYDHLRRKQLIVFEKQLVAYSDDNGSFEPLITEIKKYYIGWFEKNGH